MQCLLQTEWILHIFQTIVLYTHVQLGWGVGEEKKDYECT